MTGQARRRRATARSSASTPRWWPRPAPIPALGAILPMLTQMMSVGVYDIPKVRFKAVAVLTNNTTIGAYRGAGRPEATQLIERVLDVAADQIGMDPAEIRRRELHPARARSRSPPRPARTTTRASTRRRSTPRWRPPATTPCGPSRLGAAPTGDAEAARHRRVDLRGGHRPGRAAHRVRRRGGRRRRLGQRLRRAPACTARATTPPSPCWPATCSASPWTDHAGQLRHRPGAPRRRARMGSRSLQTAGSAIHVASTEVLDRARQHRRPPARGDRRATSSWATAACRWPGCRPRSCRGPSWRWPPATLPELPDGLEPAPLRHELDFDGTDSTYPFGAHVSVVEVDTETGQVTMLRHVAVDDCGRILNPLLVAGQQHGGIAQGAAQALYEWMQYDDDGNPLTVEPGRLRHPVGRRAVQLRGVQHRDRQPPQPAGRQGHRRVGHHRLDPRHPERRRRRACRHLGVTHIDMPCTAERVWQAIQAVS